MIILAPMAGVTDLAFRLIVKRFGCDLVVSEMISAQGLLHDNKNTRDLLKSDKKEKPLAIQLFGHDPSILADAAQIIEDKYQPAMIDLNMGCPTPKIVKNGDGAALLTQPQLIEKIVAKVVEAVDIPVTVKTRLGWDQRSINCLAVAKRIEQAGAYWITVHARTRDQFYAGKADWQQIALIKQQINIPVVGNGDVTDARLAKELFDKTGCDHIMVGRGVLGKPWLLHQIKKYLQTGEEPLQPELADRFNIILEHLKLKIRLQGEEQAVKEMRSHLAWYLKGLPNSNKARALMNNVTSYDEAKAILQVVLDQLAP